MNAVIKFYEKFVKNYLKIEHNKFISEVNEQFNTVINISIIINFELF